MGQMPCLPVLFFLLLLSLITISTVTHSLNLDTKFPVKLLQPLRLNGSHFGYSLAADVRTQNPRIFVSAPKSNSTIYNVLDTGAIYSCRLPVGGRVFGETVSCQEVDVTSGLKSRTRKTTFGSHFVEDTMTRHMFLGSSISLSPDRNDVLACGHLWTNEIRIRGYDSLNPSGRCWIFDAESEKAVDTLLPFTVLEKQVRNSTYYFSHAATGFSSSYSSDGSSLLLGSPGFYQWKGTVVSYTHPKYAIGDEEVLENVFTPLESYMGYSMTVGKFFSSVNAVVLGAPRDRYLGAVYMYFPLSSAIKLSNKLSQGSHVGEYFGYSVLAVDLNSDGLDDLLVGAPMFTPSAKQKGDRGRVVVYANSGNGLNTLRYQTVRGDNVAGSRFGSSLAKMGDINKDGNEDVAIGAPYEAGSGAVYIYLGEKHSTNILRDEYSQKIMASQVMNGLAGFGLSIASADLDFNGYPDLVIGSYLSDQVHILRSQPLGMVKASLNFSVNPVSLDGPTCFYSEAYHSCFDMQVCLHFTSHRSKDSESVRILISCDTITTKRGQIYGRAFFEDNGKSELERTFTILKDTETCFQLPKVLVKPKFEDRLTPLEFSVALLDREEEPTSFCPDCPIFKGRMNWTSSIFFENGCGTDRRCVSVLSVGALASIKGEQVTGIISGEYETLDVEVNVENTGELSYGTRLLLEVTPALNVYRLDQSCTFKRDADTTKTRIECEVGNPLVSSATMIISLDITDLDHEVNAITMQIALSSASEIDSALSVDKTSLVLPVKRMASVSMEAKQKGQSLIENAKIRTEGHSRFQMTGIVTKENSSPVRTIKILIHMPTLAAESKEFLIWQPKSEILRGENMVCELDDFAMLPTIESLGSPPSAKSASANSERANLKRVTRQDEDPANLNQTGLTLRIDCSNSDCKVITCTMGPFTRKRQKMFFELDSALNLTSVAKNYAGNYTRIEYVVDMEARILDEDVSGDQLTARTSQVVTFLEAPYSQEVAKWILVTSSGAGILLFLLILICLISTGFFKRKTRDDFERRLMADTHGAGGK